MLRSLTADRQNLCSTMMGNIKNNKGWQPVPTAIGLFSALLFGLATPASKTLLSELNPFLLAGLLYFGAAIGVIPLILRERSSHSVRPGIRPRQSLYIAGAVLFGGFLGPVLLLLGLKSAHASSVAIWLNMELVATAFLGVLLFHDTLETSGWIGVGFALIAGIIITFSEGTTGLLAAAFVSAACFCWGLDNHFTAMIDCFTPSLITLCKGIFAGTTNIVIGLALAGTFPGPWLTTKALILGSFSYGASIVLYVIAAQQLGATRGQILFSCSPFFGVALAALFLGEQISSLHLVAMLCLGCAVYFCNRTSHEHEHSHPEATHTHVHRHDDGHHDHLHDSSVAMHSHTHTHQKLTHSHPHYPDIHHRHRH